MPNVFASLKALRRRSAAAPTASPPAPSQPELPPPTSNQARARLLELLRSPSEPPLLPQEPASHSDAPVSDLTAPHRAPSALEAPATPISAAESSSEPAPMPWQASLWFGLEWRRFVSVVVGLLHQKQLRVLAMHTHGLCGMDLTMRHAQQQLTPLTVRCLGAHDEVTQQDVHAFVRLLRQQRLRTGVLVTRSRFTPAAREMARAHRIQPLDGEDLVKLILRQSLQQQQVLWLSAHAGEPARPSCVQCGSKMNVHTREDTKQRFWACDAPTQCGVQLPATHTKGHPDLTQPSPTARLKITISGRHTH